MAKISIIMLVDKSAECLRESLNSVINQTYEDWELIIINEFVSDDSTRKIIHEYTENDNRISVIQNTKVMRKFQSLNNGLDVAKGKYIARISANSICNTKRLETQFKFMEENIEYVACGVKNHFFQEEWQLEKDHDQIYSDNIFFESILSETLFVRAETLKNNNVGYSENCDGFEDFNLCSKLFKYGKVSNILDESLMEYTKYFNIFMDFNKNYGNDFGKNIMINLFDECDLKFSEEEVSVLYPYSRFNEYDNKEIEQRIVSLDLLLKKILEFNMSSNKYDMECLSLSLHKRWKYQYDVILSQTYGGKDKIPENLKEIFEHSIFYQKCFYKEYTNDVSDTPTVSIVMPCYNGEKYLYESILSLQNQTFEDWELVIVNDASKDNSVLIINEYRKNDKRIRIINNDENLRISRTLNKGIENARGKYIARMDDDDISLRTRLEKQVKFLEENKDISLVGSFRRHFGNNEWIHKPPFSPDDMKASLLFTSEVCHSTIMFRKEDFVNNDLFYNPDMLSEDYELWTRAIHKLKFATLQEVLGEYRLNGDNITSGKAKQFNDEAQKIVAKTLKEYLHINVSDENLILLSGWLNPFDDRSNPNREELLKREYELLELIYEKNKQYKVYNEKSLEKVLTKRKEWIEGYNENRTSGKISIVMPVYNSAEYLRESIESILEQTYTDWEFLIINEFGSNDGSKEIIEEYATVDNRIVLIQNTERLGISASMNVGIDRATGKYVARMDADDISLPDRFKKQVEFLENNPDVGMCGTKVTIFGSNPFEWALETNKNKLDTNILFYSPSVHPTIMIRKEIIDTYDLRYNTAYKATEDYDLFSRICEVTSVANLNETVFKYRIMENNATFRNNDIGIVIYSEVMQRQFKKMGLEFTEEEIKLLSPHFSMKKAQGREVLERLIELDLLLKKILVANEKCKLYNRKYLSNTLHERYKEAYESIAWECKDYDADKAREIYNKSIFRNEYFYEPPRNKQKVTPKVTVLMPTYNSEKYVLDTIWSVLNQSYKDFEFLIINEFGSDDDTLNIIRMFNDPRIVVIQNKERLGLAESLNVGIKEAKGKYIARIDADDLCDNDRLKLQVEFLERNLEYGVCGTWQHHFGIDTDYIHKVPISHKDLKAEFIYNCELCHSTIMIRKELFIENNLFYNEKSAAEDYELWTRAVNKFKFANLPRILGEYRIGNDNITAKKMQSLAEESAEIAFNNITEILKVSVPESHKKYLSGWINEFNSIRDGVEYKKVLRIEKEILKAMWKSNKELNIYDEDSLLKVINRRWMYATNSFQNANEVQNILPIDKLFDAKSIEKQSIQQQSYVGKKQSIVKRGIKKVLKIFYKPIKRKIIDRFVQQLWDLDGHLSDVDGHLKDSVQDIKDIIWNNKVNLMDQIKVFNDKFDTILEKQEQLQNNYIDKVENNVLQKLEESIGKAEKNIIATTDERLWKSDVNLIQYVNELEKEIVRVKETLVQQFFQSNLIEYKEGEKVRIVFLFQIASFWPSWESFYYECLNDNRFDVKLIYLDDDGIDKSQMGTAKEFLNNNKLEFIDMNDFDITEYKPHIMVYQSPYDKWHRTYSMWSESIKKMGIRIVYIPYGIEISDTNESHYAHFNEDVVKNSWRIYTISLEMEKDYIYYLKNNKHAVRSFGLPKFDGLYDKERFQMKEEIKEKANGRKVLLWKVHFPKYAHEEENTFVVTPYIDEYLKFYEYIKKCSDLFVVLMPHPRFCEENIGKETQEKCINLINLAKETENIYVDFADDYRYSLLNADSIIVDRSSVMVEASVTGVPILYMSNQDYYEPTTKAITLLIESYYQGTTCEDMIKFIEMIKRNEDPRKEERRLAFKKCIPYFDGKCGNRIKEDIITSLELEYEN